MYIANYDIIYDIYYCSYVNYYKKLKHRILISTFYHTSKAYPLFKCGKRMFEKYKEKVSEFKSFYAP